MIRFARRVTLPAVIVGLLVFAAVASAQTWRPFEFTSGGKYEFHVQQFEYSSWDDSVTETEYFYTLSVRDTGSQSEDGERLWDVTTGTRRQHTDSELADLLNFNMFSFTQALMFGNPFEYMVLLMALEDIDFEVGERITVLGMGRVSIVAEETVAGRTGLVLRHEVGDSGDRRVALEWVVDEKLPLPLTVRQYDDEGRVVLQTVLVSYEDQ